MLTFAEAVAAHRAADFETARLGYEAALPKLNAALNLASLHYHHGQHDEAERLFRLIVAQRPGNADARYGLSLVLLATSRYAEGWALYEARRCRPNTFAPDTSSPEWQGDPVVRKHLVVCGEQGFGDQIQFARYLPELARRDVS